MLSAALNGAYLYLFDCIIKSAYRPVGRNNEEGTTPLAAPKVCPIPLSKAEKSLSGLNTGICDNAFNEDVHRSVFSIAISRASSISSYVEIMLSYCPLVIRCFLYASSACAAERRRLAVSSLYVYSADKSLAIKSQSGAAVLSMPFFSA